MIDYRRWVSAQRWDVAAAVVLAISMMAWSWHRSSQLSDVLYQYRGASQATTDLWFDADIPRNTCMMTDRHAGHHFATSRHPLLSMLQFFPVQAAAATFGLAPIASIRLVVAIQSGLWIAVFFALLRAAHVRRIDAALFTVLASVSAAAMFWTVVPESFVLGAIALAVPALITARPGRGLTLMETAAHVFALGTTVTNWASAAIATLSRRSRGQALQIGANAVVMVSLLGAAQASVFPSAVLFPGSGQVYDDGPNFEMSSVTDVARVFVLHSMVMPDVILLRRTADADMLSVQSSPAADSPLATAALALWLALFGAGIWQLISGRAARVVSAWLAALLAVQFGLHVIVGTETFLYAMHFTPLLVVVAALGTQSRYRRAVLVVTVVATIVIGINNDLQFAASNAIVWARTGEVAALGATFGPPFECPW